MLKTTIRFKQPKDNQDLMRLTKALSKRAEKIKEAMVQKAQQDSTEFKPTAQLNKFYETFGPDVELFELKFTDLRPDVGLVFTRLYTDRDLMLRMKMIADATIADTCLLTARAVQQEERDEVLKQSCGRTVNSRHPFTPCLVAIIYRIDPSGPVALCKEFLTHDPAISLDRARAEYIGHTFTVKDPTRYTISVVKAVVDAPTRVCKHSNCAFSSFDQIMMMDRMGQTKQ